MSNMAAAYTHAGKPDRAIDAGELAVERQKVRLGPDHPSTLLNMNNLATAYLAAGRLNEALHLLEETLEKTKKPSTARIIPTTLSPSTIWLRCTSRAADRIRLSRYSKNCSKR